MDYRWSAYGGAAIGILGGMAGAYCGIKRMNLREERALMWRFLLLSLMLMALFAIGFLLIPGYYRFLVFIPFGIGIFVLVHQSNDRRTALQTAPQEHSGVASR
jgi:RsiW-degrading membrane proteinase PrsW (M82 family)